MEYTHLGRSGLVVSRLCLGTLPFGALVKDNEAWEIMDQAHEVGINFFDTSDVYGWQDGGDWSENVIGRWFSQGGGRRERTVLATKVYQPRGSWPNDGRLSALHIRRACEASLTRLQTDHIDLYQMHHVDRDTPWDEVWEAMEVLRYQGKILYAGSSNFAGWHLAQAQEAANARHFLGLISEQSVYNLLRRDLEREVLPAAISYGIGVMVWSPLQRGMLAGILPLVREEIQSGTATTHLGQLPRVDLQLVEKHRSKLEQYDELCAAMNTPPAHVALAWLLSRPGVACAIIGPTVLQHLNDVISCLEVRLDDATLTQLDEIFPGYLTSPEDHAW
jgi:NDP-hexose 2,3-enoyl reductase